MEHDLIAARFLSDNERYADLLNGIGFGGENIISAEDLSDLDSRGGLWQTKKAGGRKGKKPKYRDLIRKVAFGVNFAVVGVENQEEVHYLMPLRVMGYDVAEYERQAAKIKKAVRKKQNILPGEFL